MSFFEQRYLERLTFAGRGIGVLLLYFAHHSLGTEFCLAAGTLGIYAGTVLALTGFVANLFE